RLGLAARFVTGYLYDDTLGKTQGGGSTHAWCSVYLPGAGWVEYDPTNGFVAGAKLIRVGVTRTAEQAIPISGGYIGDRNDPLRLDVCVAVSAVPMPQIDPLGRTRGSGSFSRSPAEGTFSFISARLNAQASAVSLRARE